MELIIPALLLEKRQIIFWLMVEVEIPFCIS